MNRTLAAALLTLLATSALAQEKTTLSAADLDKAVAASWPKLTPELQIRISQDEPMRICSESRNNPAQAEADKLVALAKSTMVYPADGAFMGDWRKGEKGSLNGYGFRMRDDPKRPVGGNCYACHQMSPKEISYGTLGPSLLGYGKIKGNTPEAQKEVYEKIYNAQSVLACSNMPRFGHNKVLSPEAIKDYVAFLLDPASPVNQDQ